MKRLIFLFVSIFLIAFFLFSVFQKDQIETPPVQIQTPPTSTPVQPAKTVSYNQREYTFEFFIVSDSTHISLIPNFKNPSTAKVLIEENSCTYAINAGFYSPQNNPVGLWKNRTETLGRANQNSLLNGFYSTDVNGASIGYDVPTQSDIAFQTGPILIYEDNPIKLAIKNDEPARRMVAGINSTGESVFMTIYDPLSRLQGPYLGDLPYVTTLISEKSEIPLITAINLDGGSASAYYSETVQIWELNPIGSLLCIN